MSSDCPLGRGIVEGREGAAHKIIYVAFLTTDVHSLSHSEILHPGGEPWFWKNELKYVWKAPKP